MTASSVSSIRRWAECSNSHCAKTQPRSSTNRLDSTRLRQRIAESHSALRKSVARTPTTVGFFEPASFLAHALFLARSALCEPSPLLVAVEHLAIPTFDFFACHLRFGLLGKPPQIENILCERSTLSRLEPIGRRATRIASVACATPSSVQGPQVFAQYVSGPDRPTELAQLRAQAFAVFGLRRRPSRRPDHTVFAQYNFCWRTRGSTVRGC